MYTLNFNNAVVISEISIDEIFNAFSQALNFVNKFQKKNTKDFLSFQRESISVFFLKVFLEDTLEWFRDGSIPNKKSFVTFNAKAARDEVKEILAHRLTSEEEEFFTAALITLEEIASL